MISRIGRLHCDECGKLIGKSDLLAIRWSPWGSGFTPPDEGHLCGKCAGERTPKEVEYHRSAWIPERRINDTANTVHEPTARTATENPNP